MPDGRSAAVTLDASPYRTVIEAMFRVVAPDASDQDVQFRPIQELLDARWSRRNIIAKSRRHGVSTYVIWRFLAKCLTQRNRRCMLVSHEREATARLFSIAKYTLDNLKGAPAVVGRNNRGELYFDKTNSTFWIGTAGAENLGHGDTITDLHWSEAAHTNNAEELRKGLFPAADAGEITVESTGNGVGNWFHQAVTRAAEGRGFTLHFFPYTDDLQAYLPFANAADKERFMSSLRAEYAEPELAELLAPEVLNWRREKIDILFEGDLRAFTEQYPRTLDECFQATGHSFFPQINFVPSDEWKQRGALLWVLGDHPKPGVRYVIGADVGAGVGRDNSVGHVLSLESMEQVAEFVSNGLDPDMFGIELAHLGSMFNYAYMNVEQNNHGLTTIRALKDEVDVEGRKQSRYPVHLIHQGRRTQSDNVYETQRLMSYGTFVNETIRGSILGGLRSALREDYVIHSPLLKAELGSFVEKENGKLEAESGCHDDRVMAAAHAVSCIERAASTLPVAGARTRRGEAVDPFSWEAIFGEASFTQDLPFTAGRWD